MVLVDAGPASGGTSGESFAHVNASTPGYWAYVDLRRAGAEGYNGLREELDGAGWWHETGYLAVNTFLAGIEDLDTHVERLHAMDYPVENLIADPPDRAGPGPCRSDAGPALPH